MTRFDLLREKCKMAKVINILDSLGNPYSKNRYMQQITCRKHRGEETPASKQEPLLIEYTADWDYQEIQKKLIHQASIGKQSVSQCTQSA
jgi:hypothetical protein